MVCVDAYFSKEAFFHFILESFAIKHFKICGVYVSSKYFWLRNIYYSSHAYLIRYVVLVYRRWAVLADRPWESVLGRCQRQRARSVPPSLLAPPISRFAKIQPIATGSSNCTRSFAIYNRCCKVNRYFENIGNSVIFQFQYLRFNV